MLGIDFGTSFSTVAVWLDGRLYIVPDERGQPCVPSVIYVPPRGDLKVGFEARQLATQQPQNVIRGIKRVLGKAPTDGAFRLFAAQNSVDVKAGPNNTVVIKVAGRTFTVVQLVAEVLRRMKTMAEARFRLKARQAVLSIPTSAGPAVKRDLVHAAKLAGLRVVDTVAEPVAGAMAYGADQAANVRRRRLLVYDFGGGTFDVTVLLQEGQTLRALATGGDNLLGGDDFDEKLANAVGSRVWREHKVDLTKDVVAWQRVLYQSELVKQALSGTEQVRLRIRDLLTSGPVRDLDLQVLRDRMEPKWQGLVDRSLKITVKTMVESALRPDDIDYVVMIGGTTFIPLVQQTLATVLKRQGMHIDDPQTAVAAGAAMLGARVLKMAA